MKPHYSFDAKLWIYPREGAWHFVTVPKRYTAELKDLSNIEKRGFGSIKVIAQIGQSKWHTSIFPDNRLGSYLLPIKKGVRQANAIQAGSEVKLTLFIVGL